MIYLLPPLLALFIIKFKISSNFFTLDQNDKNFQSPKSKNENKDRICSCFNGIISLIAKDTGIFKFSIILGIILVIGIQLMGGAFGFIDLAFYEIDYASANLDNYCDQCVPHFVILCISDCMGSFITSFLYFFIFNHFPPQKIYKYFFPIIVVVYTVIIILTQIYILKIAENIYLQVRRTKFVLHNNQVLPFFTF